MNKVWDIAVIGAGAAGLMTAVTAGRLGHETLLIDGKEKIGAKILMSGGTRCNITNQTVLKSDFETECDRTLSHVLKAFPAQKAARFFEEIGIELVLEDGGKYFPSTHSGKTVLNAFVREVSQTGVSLRAGERVDSIVSEGGLFRIQGRDFSHLAKAVVLTTGGLSFPATGSDGAGYEIAKAFGHSIVPTSPSLTPLETTDPDWTSLSGLSLPVRLTLWMDQKKTKSFEGSFLFTHFGFSGPVVLNISRHWLRRKRDGAAKLAANFLPGQTEDALRQNLLDAASAQPGLSMIKFLSQFLPARFCETLLRKAGVETNTALGQLPRKERDSLLKLLTHCPLEITGDRGYAKAEVTAGGVPLTEVNSSTLESEKCPGLFFAGEILDVDGRIGGFNFQWAWSSGYVAATGVHRHLES